MEHETVTSQENGERLIKLGLVGAVVLFFATGAIFDPFSSEQDAYTMIARLLSGLLCFLLVARGWKLIRNKSDRLDDILDIVFGSILVVALIVLTGYVLIVKPTPEPPGSRCSSCVNGELMEGAVSRMAATPDDHSDGVFFEKLRDLYSAVLKEDSPKEA